MHVIAATNVNEAFQGGADLIRTYGVKSDSRAGPVLEIEAPVTTIYEHPEECVLFDARRDANPFFHLMEAMWMLDGRDDVEWLARFLPSIVQFSDDGSTLRGAYGYRWRHWFMDNQLRDCIDMLRRDPDTRRVVLGHWDPTIDLGADSKDIPCNTHVYFSRRRGRLDMMVSCRSNDMIWGAYGANAVHFSILMQYVAGMLGVPLGRYYQVSFNFHVYKNVWDDKVDAVDVQDPYHFEQRVDSFKLIHYPESWDLDLRSFMAGLNAFQNPFFTRVAAPMRDAYLRWRAGDKTMAYETLCEYSSQIDWIAAGKLWMERRL
jgi:hypothetical protein